MRLTFVAVSEFWMVHHEIWYTRSSSPHSGLYHNYMGVNKLKLAKKYYGLWLKYLMCEKDAEDGMLACCSYHLAQSIAVWDTREICFQRKQSTFIYMKLVYLFCTCCVVLTVLLVSTEGMQLNPVCTDYVYWKNDNKFQLKPATQGWHSRRLSLLCLLVRASKAV